MIIWRVLYSGALILLSLLPVDEISAQAVESGQEVYLSFRHEGVVNHYVTAYYLDDGSFLLPQLELFRLLELPVSTDLATTTTSGTFPSLGEWRINFSNGSASRSGTRLEFSADRFLITNFDFFIHPDLLYELFGLDFRVNFNQLSLSLSTETVMPVVARVERERRRARAGRRELDLVPDFHPLRYDRDRKMLQGGFLEYNVTSNISNDQNSYLFQSALGTEMAGGDLQGTILASWSRRSNTLRSSGLRWRYGVRDNPWLTRVTVGQNSSRGLLPVSYTGLQLSNEPLEPRLMYDTYRFQGRTVPGAEVELYRNNALVDYRLADGQGDYRFDFPLTYGTSRYNLRIFSPDGELTERHTRIQIPYSFVPRGEVNYTISGGRLDNPLPGTTDRNLFARGRVSTGLTNWLTASGSVEYFDEWHDGLPTFAAGLTGRFRHHYLVSAEIADNVLFRTSANVIYPSGVSFGLNYDHFFQQGGIYNRAGNRSRLQGNLFTPFQVGSLPLFFRTAFTHENRAVRTQTRYNMDLSSRIGRTSLRLSYRDTQIDGLEWRTTPSSRFAGSITYAFPRSRTVWGPARGLYLRGQVSWLPHQSALYDGEVQVSRRIFESGRIQMAAGRNVQGAFNFLRMSLSFDFNRIRTTTSFRNSRDSYNLSQGVRGSVGLSPENSHLNLNNRQQVGGAALAVRLFVDHSNSGTYEEGDELLETNAIRLERGGGTVIFRDGISYITMLQPYRQYNLSVNKTAFHNPMLLPLHERFSVVTDPNQYKVIDVPLYMSGIVEGRVTRQQNGTVLPVSGARLSLRNLDEEGGFSGFEEELRTFSDGSFYAYEIPPGRYELAVDPEQLRILDLRMEEGPVALHIESTAEGDFLSGVAIRLVPNRESESRSDPDDDDPAELHVEWLTGQPEWLPAGRFRAGSCRFPLQAGSYSTARLAAQAASDAERITGLHMELTFNAISGIYAVRTSQAFPFPDAVKLAETHSGKLPGNDLAVITQCESREREIRPVPVSFHIQLGAFRSRTNAERLLSMAEESLGLNLSIRSDESGSIHRVQAGPLRAVEVFELANRIRALEIVRDVYIIQTSESAAAGLRFDYYLQAGRFDSTEAATSCAHSIRDELQEPVYLLIDESDSVHLMLKRRFRNWGELLELRNRLDCNGDLTTPVIHLIETPVRL